MITWVVFGLGNPGPQYALTRHNAGFMAIDAFLKVIPASQIIDSGSGSRLVWSTVSAATSRMILIKPMTYMNLSGEAYEDAMRRFHFQPSESLVIYDDVSMMLGKIRVRQQGSSGGQKGIDSILRLLGTQQLKRIKLGIGPKPDECDLSDYVLQPFSADESVIFHQVLARVSTLLQVVRKAGFDRAVRWLSIQQTQGGINEM